MLCITSVHGVPCCTQRNPVASSISLLWAGGTTERKVLSSSTPFQAAILVLQKTMSEQDRRLLLLWMSVLQQQQKAKQAIRLSLTERARVEVLHYGAGADLGLHLEHISVQSSRG